jgi:hypothetical protein
MTKEADVGLGGWILCGIENETSSVFINFCTPKNKRLSLVTGFIEEI